MSIDKQNQKATPKKKLVLREEALRKLTLNDEELKRVVGGQIPGPIVPGDPPAGRG